MELTPSMVPPLRLLDRWMLDARAAGIADPRSVAFVTVGPDAKPTARTVSLKRVEADALVFTSARWTRKVRELEANPQVALLFHWGAIGRQVHVAGRATLGERALAVELFDERDLAHRVQTLVSRQGEPIDDLESLRARQAHLMEALEAPPECPPDWGAIRVVPDAVELWSEAPDRLHDRLLYERGGRASGLETRLDVTGVNRVQAGRIVRAQYFFDHAEALKALGWSRRCRRRTWRSSSECLTRSSRATLSLRWKC